MPFSISAAFNEMVLLASKLSAGLIEPCGRLPTTSARVTEIDRSVFVSITSVKGIGVSRPRPGDDPDATRKGSAGLEIRVVLGITVLLKRKLPSFFGITGCSTIGASEM